MTLGQLLLHHVKEMGAIKCNIRLVVSTIMLFLSIVFFINYQRMNWKEQVYSPPQFMANKYIVPQDQQKSMSLTSNSQVHADMGKHTLAQFHRFLSYMGNNITLTDKMIGVTRMVDSHLKIATEKISVSLHWHNTTGIQFLITEHASLGTHGTRGGSNFQVMQYFGPKVLEKWPCNVIDHFNGTYTAICPYYGCTCSRVSITICYVQFEAFIEITRPRIKPRKVLLWDKIVCSEDQRVHAKDQWNATSNVCSYSGSSINPLYSLTVNDTDQCHALKVNGVVQ
jgi:hypothetical protein